MASSSTPESSASYSRPRKGSWLQLFRPFDFEWNHARITLPGLPKGLHGFRIIHLTDLHLRDQWHPAYDRLLELVRKADADLILYTGDFVDDKYNHLPAIPNVRRLAEGLRSKLGCYAILGNHDKLSFGPRLSETQVQLLCGKRVELSARGETIELIGLPGATREDLPEGYGATIPNRQPLAAGGNLRIVLSHFPDHILCTREIRPDLFLAGHTHGGQICLPGGIPIVKHDRLPMRYCSGVNRFDDTWMIVGRGFGSTTLPMRIFCPPEVIEIELVGSA